MTNANEVTFWFYPIDSVFYNQKLYGRGYGYGSGYDYGDGYGYGCGYYVYVHGSGYNYVHGCGYDDNRGQ